MVGGVASEAHLVGDDHHGHAFLGQGPHDAGDLTDQFGIERRGGLVEEHDRRVHGQSAGDGDTLLLAAGELRRIGISLL